jgi:hypothetical protein
MYKFLVSIIFIFFAQSALATTIEAELAKPKAYEYESLDYEFRVLPLKNTEKWCYEFNSVERCRDVVAQIVVTHDLNFLINEKYKADVRYDDLKLNKFCEQGKVRPARLNEYKSFDLRLTVFCAEGNNIITYTFKYLPDIKGIGLEKMYYVTCSSNNLTDYIIPLLSKFNSFKNSQMPKIASHKLELDSPLTGEFFRANLVKTGNSKSLKCQGDSGLNITITMNEYLQKQIKNTSSPNKGWYNDVYTEPNSDPINGPDLYTNTIKKYMEELAKQNKPKF